MSTPRKAAAKVRPLVPRHIQELEPYRAGKSTEELRRELGLKKIIKLASNENPLGASPKALQAMQTALSEVNRYPSSDFSDLRRALARRYDVKTDNVFAAHGSEGIIAIIMGTFLLDDEEALTSANSFISFRIQAQSRGIKLCEVPLIDSRLDLGAIAGHIHDKTKVIYLANPNNPTGTIFTVRELLSFMKRVPEGVLVILDEVLSLAARFESSPRLIISCMRWAADSPAPGAAIRRGLTLAGIISTTFKPLSPAPRRPVFAQLSWHPFLRFAKPMCTGAGSQAD